MPDHVRNPHKYTVYQFDEAVTVGGGDRSATVSGQDNDQVRAPTNIPNSPQILANKVSFKPLENENADRAIQKPCLCLSDGSPIRW